MPQCASRSRSSPTSYSRSSFAPKHKTGNRFAEVRFGPRTIDLDILWIKNRAVSTDILEIPHPRLAERAFALVPLYEVAPDAMDPRTGKKWLIPEGDTVLVASL